ncbi:group 10 secretory phospholipase A2 isoform X2 [Pelobates fuscus]|uniref:group 10 secretory phospholipase A2 isoform X2 n=1 Tax=Pelobates fuscus TaxID=191477 RepID=UPI002FE43D0E
MEIQIFFLLSLYKFFKGALGTTHVLQRRGLFELDGAIKCEAGRSSLIYIGYGCYCGLGGHGMPKDNIDWCCHKHDCCYDEAEKLGCKTKMGSYKWTCKDSSVQCDALEDRCQKLTCKCDKDIARCLRSTSYNAKYILYPNFLCGSSTPACNMYKKPRKTSKEDSSTE